MPSSSTHFKHLPQGSEHSLEAKPGSGAERNISPLVAIE
jgi:hypothetical protein